jgi:cardiolipin synthase C
MTSPDAYPAELCEVIADLAAHLPRGHLSAWLPILRDATDPDPVIVTRLIEARPGPGVAAKVKLLTDAWQAATGAVNGMAIALALETAAQLHTTQVAQRSDVVISGPARDSAALRLTSSVVTELIRRSRKSLLIVSFAAFGVADVVAELARAAKRGVTIDLVLESTLAHGGTLHGTTEASATFDAIKEHATFWIWPAARRPVIGTSRSALHAKLIAADAAIALVGSANLTDKALASNLELGVILRDPSVVHRIERHFRSLMRPGTGPLERLAGRPPSSPNSRR